MSYILPSSVVLSLQNIESPKPFFVLARSVKLYTVYMAANKNSIIQHEIMPGLWLHFRHI